MQRLKQERPTLDYWIDVTMDIYIMEKVTFYGKLKKYLFLEKYRKWVEFVSERRSDFVIIHGLEMCDVKMTI